MTTLFYREQRFLVLAVLMILAIGATTLTTIGRQEDPTITNLFATIITPFSGADPARVEALVTEKIEEELEAIPEIDVISSTSRSGISVVTVELSQFISDTEIEQAWSEIRDALSDAALRFPPGVPEPGFDNDRTGAFTAISAITPRHGSDVPLAIIGRYGELLQDRLRGVGGTELVRLFGEPREEILVELRGDVLTSAGLRIDDVTAAIAAADVKVEAGQMRGARQDLLIEIEGEIDDLARLRAIPLVGADGGPLMRVGDVAEIRRQVKSPPDTLAFTDGAPAVVIAARMEPDLQVDAWMARVRTALAEFEASLPDGLEHRLLFDQSTYTIERLGTLAQNLAIGVGLVVTVLLLTLGWRAALIVAAILPLTSLVSLTVLHQLGLPIHQMSVTGLIVAIGLLVDAAIVMVDEIRRRIAAGVARELAVGRAIRRLAMPLLASTITTVLAFTPMAVLPGPAGDFVGSIALAVIVMLITSLALALTLTPALAGIVLPEAERGGFLAHGIDPGWLGRVFRRSIDLSLRFPALSVLAALILPVMGFLAFPTLTAQFFPGVERDQFYVQMKLPDGSAIARTQAAVDDADRYLRAQETIEAVHWFVGESAPAFYYNMQMNQDGVSSFAEALITTSSEAATVALIPRVQAHLNDSLLGTRVIVRDLVQGPPVGAPVELRLVGPNLQTLRELGDQARTLMSEVPEITITQSDLIGGPPKLVFNLDEDKVRLAGLDLGSVARQLETLLEGATGGSLVESTEELPVRVRLAENRRDSVQQVADLAVLPRDARALVDRDLYPGIPLRSLGDLEIVPGDSPIARRNGERVNNVQAYVQLGVLPEEALAKLQELLAAEPLPLPSGYRIEWGGDTDARQETTTNLMSSMGLTVAGLVGIIVVTFRSFRLSAIAAAVCVLSMGLSLLALAVFVYPFGIQALIGVIGSIGVSINAAIIIMTALQEDRSARRGDRQAIGDVVAAASRHIVSTTITTFGGFLPLILAGGGFWPPFAMAIAGGVLLSTVVSFYFVPPMFLMLYAAKRAAPHKRQRAPLAFPQAAE